MAESNGKPLMWVAVIAGGLFLALISLVVMIPLLLGGAAQKAEAAPNCSPDTAPANEEAGKTNIAVPEQYKGFLEKAAKTSGLPVAVLAAQIQAESGWNPKASSGVANGLTQFTPATWASYGNGKSVWDPEAAIDAQARYMRDLLGQVGSLAKSEEDKVKLALAAYNAGPGAVQKANGIPPFEETQNYVKKIMRNAQIEFTGDCTPAVDSADAISLGPGEWTSPVPGGKVTSGYGARPCPLSSCAGMPFLLRHEGIDLAGGSSKVFFAPTDMDITYVGLGVIDKLWSSYGEYIYAVQVDPPHLVFEFHEAAKGSLLVKKGQRVKAGTPLGKPGATGNSSGIHVHFQINKPGTNVNGPTIQNGKSVDPLPYLREKGVAP